MQYIEWHTRYTLFSLSSGLTEGDHIIYIDTRNIQAIRTFDEMTLIIQRIFEEVGQVTLVTLTAPAYQVLKRKGGYLQPEPFDYQLPFVRELSPRLCKILLYNHEQDFGFTLQRGNPIHIKDVHSGSPAYEHGLRSNDKILELNGRDTVSLSSEQMIDIIESSKRRRQLDILVIDTAGYEFSIKHAIPLNSLLPFVQPGHRRGKIFTQVLSDEFLFVSCHATFELHGFYGIIDFSLSVYLSVYLSPIDAHFIQLLNMSNIFHNIQVDSV
jgi:hypothetical protein